MIDFPVKPEARPALESVLASGRQIIIWTQELNEHRLWADKLTRAAVERHFAIIAEALYRLRILDRWSWDKITDPEAAMGLGDAIRRDYDEINYGILWRATREELPALLAEVEQLLAKPATRS